MLACASGRAVKCSDSKVHAQLDMLLNHVAQFMIENINVTYQQKTAKAANRFVYGQSRIHEYSRTCVAGSVQFWRTPGLQYTRNTSQNDSPAANLANVA